MNKLRKDIVIDYLKSSNDKKKDEYIYSIYSIDKNNNNDTFTCIHFEDITQKNLNTYSIKSSRYSNSISPYEVKFIDDKIISEYK